MHSIFKHKPAHLADLPIHLLGGLPEDTFADSILAIVDDCDLNFIVLAPCQHPMGHGHYSPSSSVQDSIDIPTAPRPLSLTADQCKHLCLYANRPLVMNANLCKSCTWPFAQGPFLQPDAARPPHQLDPQLPAAAGPLSHRCDSHTPLNSLVGPSLLIPSDLMCV